MQSGEVLSGNLTVPADCIEKRYWRRDKHEPKVMPLCVEALSLHLIQSFICGGLGLQYGGKYCALGTQIVIVFVLLRTM